MGEARAPVIIKLGGSVITRKNETERLRPKVLRRLAEEIAAVPEVPVVVLHGAGSFGHASAARFGLASAPSTPRTEGPHRTRGAAIVSREVRRLHGEVLTALVDAGARPWSIPISTHAENREGALARLDSAPFRGALERGTLPVSFGDVVPDLVWGFSILSADRIAVGLAGALSAHRVLFVSDVEGIMEPGTTGRRRAVEVVTRDVVDGLRPANPSRDVTGGIRGKAVAMLEVTRLGADAALISGLSDGALSRAIRGEAVYGSWARAASR